VECRLNSDGTTSPSLISSRSEEGGNRIERVVGQETWDRVEALLAEHAFIPPTIIGRRLEINNLAVIPSLLFRTWMWGPIGALLASPLLIMGLIVREHLRQDASN
jgi:hypothetical protein